MRLATSRLIPLVLILSITSMGFNGCGDPKQIGEVAEAAKDIGGGTRDVIKAISKAYDEKLITIEQKDKFADLLIAIAKGGQVGVGVIEEIQELGLNTIPPDKQQILTAIFSDKVIAPFLELITEIAKLSPASSAAIRASLSALRTTILLLSTRIGRNDVIERIHAREVIHV